MCGCGACRFSTELDCEPPAPRVSITRPPRPSFYAHTQHSWIAAQAASSPHALWCDGARDYVKHAAALVTEFGDALAAGTGESVRVCV